MVVRFVLGLCLFSLCAFPQQDSLHSNDSVPDYLINSLNGPDEELVMDDQESNSLLGANSDVFHQFSTFSFSQGRFRFRGFNGRDQQATLDGISMNHPESGSVSWTTWGGLNDATRFQETGTGITGSPYGFAGPAGYLHISTPASSFKKGTRVSNAVSNHHFATRWMITHASGIFSNGWSFVISASGRNGKQYAPGTYIKANSFFISINNYLNKTHQLNLTGLVAPLESAGAGSALKETAELTRSNYYNASWGFQAGKARSAAVRSSAKPILILSHAYTPRRSVTLNSSLAWSFGQSSNSGLNWNGAANPRPDYYRYLPSWPYSLGDTLKGDRIADNWGTDLNTRQINWDRMTELNRANLYSVSSSGNQPNTTETRARYILEKRTEQTSSIQAASVFHRQINRMTASIGWNGLYYTNRKFKEIEDLLGATYWLDLDQFATNQTPDAFTQQNNIDEPDKKIYTNDLFGYDYTIYIRKAGLWAQGEYRMKQVDVFFAVTTGMSSIWKESVMANGKFPETSKGRSQKANFINYGLKSGASYKLSGKQFITAAFSYMTRPPAVSNIFLSPDVRNDLLSGIKSERLLSSEISYVFRTPGWRFRVTGYFNETKDQTRIKTYWSDAANTFINYIMTGVNHRQYGLEAGFEKTLFISHNLQLAAGFGEYTYSSRPVAQAWQNTTHAALFSNRVLYLKNYYTGGTPQTVIGFTYRYNSPRRWYVTANLRYFDRIYVELNPDRRSAEATERFSSGDLENLQLITAQERLPAWFTLNSQLGKTLRLTRKSSLNIHLSLNNLLNTKNIIISGAEQMRWDPQYPERFANRYTWLPGLTWLAGAALNF